MEHLPTFFTDDMLLNDIGTDELDAFVALRMAELDSNATINRKMSMLSKNHAGGDKAWWYGTPPRFPLPATGNGWPPASDHR